MVLRYDATGWTAQVRFPVVQGFFLLSVLTDSGAHPAPYSMGIWGALSPGVKRQGRESDHSPPSSAEVKEGGAIPSLLYMFSLHSA
jgi:hypothetical protein